MRIALLVRRFDPSGGGTERDFAASSLCLMRAGHEIRIYAARALTRSWHDISIRQLPIPRFSRTLEVAGFGLLAAGLARRAGADLTISFGRTVDTDVLRCEGGAHASYLKAAAQWDPALRSASRYLTPYHAAQCWMESRGFRSSRLGLVAAISQLVGGDVARRFALEPSKIEVVYNGVDLDRFRPGLENGRRLEIRRQLGIEASGPVAVFIGNGFARKGLKQLIEAWPMLGREPYLIVAGQDRSASTYHNLARRLGVERRILFLGRRQDTPDLIAAADALALPSLFEAFGNVVLEAMAAGRPVLTSARCGAAEVLPPQLQSFLVQDPSNPQEIAARLTALMPAARELGQIARTAAEQFTWDRYGERFVGLIEALPAQSKPVGGSAA